MTYTGGSGSFASWDGASVNYTAYDTGSTYSSDALQIDLETTLTNPDDPTQTYHWTLSERAEVANGFGRHAESQTPHP